jgi:hypothetical protein
MGEKGREKEREGRGGREGEDRIQTRHLQLSKKTTAVYPTLIINTNTPIPRKQACQNIRLVGIGPRAIVHGLPNCLATSSG